MATLNPTEQFGESDASKVDKAIAASAIAGYVGGAKNLKTLKGNVDVEDPIVFEKLYQDYGQSGEDVDQVPGFVNRKDQKPIKLRLPGRNSKKQLVVASTIEAAVHETVHLNSHTQFQTDFQHPYNEGVTEYFTELVLGTSGRAYRDELELAKGLIAGLGANGERDVAEAYFKGMRTLYVRVARAFGTANTAHDYREWQSRSRSKNRDDWKVASELLAAALKNPAGPAIPPAAGGSGGGAGSGSGGGSGSAGSGSR